MPVRTAWRMHSRFGTGSMPGIAASISDTCVFGSAPNAVAAPEKSLEAVAVICAWTSSPTTTSQSPVSPLMRKGAVELAIQKLWIIFADIEFSTKPQVEQVLCGSRPAKLQVIFADFAHGPAGTAPIKLIAVI